MKDKLLWVVAIGLGLFSALLVYQFLDNLTPRALPEMVEVVVASRAINRNTTISRDMLELRKVSLEGMHPETLISLQEAQGRITASEIIPGEPVLRSRLLPTGQVPGMSFTIPPGKRGITIGVNEVIGVAGFVKPGDHVDLLATFDGDPAVTLTILQNIQVLAIAQEMETQSKPAAKLSTSVTIAVTPEQAERVALAEDQGRLRLALRSPDAGFSVTNGGTSLNDFVPNSYTSYQPVVSQQIKEVPQTPASPSKPSLPTAGTKENPTPVVEVRKTAIAVPMESELTVEVVKGTKREVRIVHE